jgi:hypothetical protein
MRTLRRPYSKNFYTVLLCKIQIPREENLLGLALLIPWPWRVTYVGMGTQLRRRNGCWLLIAGETDAGLVKATDILYSCNPPLGEALKPKPFTTCE